MASFEDGEATAVADVASADDAPVSAPSEGSGGGGGGSEAGGPVGVYSNPNEAMGVSWKDAMDIVSDAVASKTPFLEVAVSEPQTTKTMMKSFVTYQVFTKPLGHVVRRRYSDFQWLRNTLSQRYSGMLIAPLPPRGADSLGTAADSSTKEDSKFVQRRMRTLSKFMDEVVSNPFLRGDEALLSFLSVQVDKEFEKAKAAASQTNMFNDSYAGCIAWRDYILHNPAPDNMDRVVLDLRKQLDYLDKSYTALLATSKKFSLKAGEYSREVDQLKASLGDVLTQEANIADDTKVEAANTYGKEMVATITNLKESVEAWCGATAQRPAIYENVVRPTLEFLLYRNMAFREMLEYRDLAKKELTAATKVLEGHRRTKEQGKDTIKSMFGKGKDIDESIAEAEENVKGKETFLGVLTNALNWSEIFRFNEARHVQFKSMVSLMSAAEKSLSAGIMEMWTTSMTSQGYDIESSLGEVKVLIPEFDSAVSAPDGAAAADVESV